MEAVMDTQGWQIGDRFHHRERPQSIYTVVRFTEFRGVTRVVGSMTLHGQGIGIELPHVELVRVEG
jgi:hypothetical protein